MRVAVVFSPDPDLIDPSDPDKQPITRGIFLDDNQDLILIWRERNDDIEDGSRDHLFSQGVWENATLDQFDDALATFDALPQET